MNNPYSAFALASVLALAACAPAQHPRAAPRVPSLDASLPPFSWPDGGPPRPPLPDEATAYRAAAPVLARWCVDCHSPSGPRHDPRAYAELGMDRYPYTGRFAWAAGLAIAEVLGATGMRITMPSDHVGAVVDGELKAVAVWAESYTVAHPLPAVRPGTDAGSDAARRD